MRCTTLRISARWPPDHRSPLSGRGKSPSLTTYHDIAMNRSLIQIAPESDILRHAEIRGNSKGAIHLQQKQRNTSPLPQVSASNGEEFAPLAAAPIDVKH